MDKGKTKGSDPNAVPGKDGSGEALWRYEVPQQDAGAGTAQSNSAHYTGGAHGGDSQQGDFLASPPDANAMPAGAPQTSRGSAGGHGQAGLDGGKVPGAGGGAPQADEDEAMPGAGGGQPEPVGNGTKDDPVWGS